LKVGINKKKLWSGPNCAQLKSRADAPFGGERLLFRCIKTVSKLYLKHALGLSVERRADPHVVGKTEKTRNGMDSMERSFTRPRQVRYQAALRPDM
jgi:hypothetical protein